MNNRQVLVSVVCLAFNHEKFIAKALDGFVMQKTAFPFNIIIHDDASTDKTASIIKEYQLKFPELFICVFQTQNQFTKNEKNIWTDLTFPLAKGKYIALCEGDDYWTDPYKLQKQVDFLEQHEEYVCHCHNAQIIENNKFVRLYNDYTTDRTLTTDDLVTTLGIPTASVVFRNCLTPMPDYLVKFPLDIIIYFALSKFGKFYQSAELMSVYRIHDKGIWSGQDTLTKMNENLKIKQFYLNEMPLTKKQKRLVMQLVVNTKLNRLKYFANQEFLKLSYFRDLGFLLRMKLSGFKFSAKFFIFCMLPNKIINAIKRK